MRLPLLLAVVLFGVSDSRDVDSISGSHVPAILALKEQLHRAIEEARSGDRARARMRVGDAYFEIFEGRGLEAAIAAVDPGSKSRLEARFSELRDAIGRGDPVHDLAVIADDIVSSTEAKLQRLPGGQGVALFLQSFLILFREGMEAILIVAAIAAYLARVGHAEKTRIVYGSAASALVASAAMALLLFALLGRASAPAEIVEGASMLVAAAVLFFVSYWLLSHAQAGRWERFIRGKVEGAVTRGSLATLAFTAFLAVFREGAETILFYQALLSSGGRDDLMSVLMGALCGAVALAAAFLSVKALGVRLPLRSFFRITGALLYLLAFAFVGRGIVELQAGQILPATPLQGAPSLPALGVFPYIEPLLGQTLLVLAALLALGVTLRTASRTARTAIASCLLLAFAAGGPAAAQPKAPFREYPIGDEKVMHGMKIAAVYLPPVPMDGQEVIPEAGKERIHLECDIHAVKGNSNGFGIGEWIPYLTVLYELYHAGTGKRVEGEMLPMVAKDGPHYGATVRMLGTGSYRLRYTIRNPGTKGFGRHTDPVTGVGDWFPDFTVEWSFEYKGAPVMQAPPTAHLRY